MADTLLSSYPDRVLTHVLGHDVDDLVGKLAVADLGGGATVLVSDTPPDTGTTPVNSLWWESDTGIMYILYDDGSSVQWVAVGESISGDVLGPVSSTDDHIAVFDGITGKLIKDGGAAIADIGGGDPGGSAGQIQYNNTTFEGMSGTSWDNTNRSLTITGVEVTANNPVFELSQTFNNGSEIFSGIKFTVTNTASAGALFFEGLLGATRKILLGTDGAVHCTTVKGPASSYGIGSDWSIGLLASNILHIEVQAGSGGPSLVGINGTPDVWQTDSTTMFGWTPGGAASSGPDTCLARVTVAVVEVNNNTAAGVGYLRLNGVAVASLPAASATYAGARGTVSNSNAALTAGIGAVVAGGGSNVVPVFCDGTNWRIG